MRLVVDELPCTIIERCFVSQAHDGFRCDLTGELCVEPCECGSLITVNKLAEENTIKNILGDDLIK